MTKRRRWHSFHGWVPLVTSGKDLFLDVFGLGQTSARCSNFYIVFEIVYDFSTRVSWRSLCFHSVTQCFANLNQQRWVTLTRILYWFCSLCGVSLHQCDIQRLGCSWALGKPRTWKNNNTSCHTPRCVEFFVKMFTNLQWSFNWFNIIPSVLILEPSGCTSGLLGEWLTKSCRWTVELLWLPMALQYLQQVSWRPLPFGYVK